MNNKLVNNVKVFVLPLVFFGSFLLILLGFIIPRIQIITEKLDIISSNIEQTEIVDRELNRISSLIRNQETTLAYIGDIEKIIPESDTQVAIFQKEISDLAKNEYNLRVIESQSGEVQVAIGANSTIDGAQSPAVIEIPSRFTMQGRFSDIEKFISDLRFRDDFIIIGEMDLNLADRNLSITSNNSSLNWELRLVLIKYQFQISDEVLVNSYYSSIPPFAVINQDVLDVLEVKRN